MDPDQPSIPPPPPPVRLRRNHNRILMQGRPGTLELELICTEDRQVTVAVLDPDKLVNGSAARTYTVTGGARQVRLQLRPTAAGELAFGLHLTVRLRPGSDGADAAEQSFESEDQLIHAYEQTADAVAASSVAIHIDNSVHAGQDAMGNSSRAESDLGRQVGDALGRGMSINELLGRTFPDRWTDVPLYPIFLASVSTATRHPVLSAPLTVSDDRQCDADAAAIYAGRLAMSSYCPKWADVAADENVEWSMRRSARVDIWRRAADCGIASAKLLVGLCMARDGEAHHPQAIASITAAAEGGHAIAQLLLSQCLDNGQLVAKSKTEAARWCRKSADQGNGEAQWRLGWMYKAGTGVPMDAPECVKWSRKSAEQGNVEAMCNLGWCLIRGDGVALDQAAAADWYRRAADAGSARGQDLLGGCYYSGSGVTEDDATAAEWYAKAAEQGYAASQYNLGYMYDEGHGVDEDDVAAAEWYRKAAVQGHAEAQSRLGQMYAEGEGVEADAVEAVEWYRKAADQGDVEAQYRLAACYYYGDGIIEDEAEAARWFRRSAEQGDAEGQYFLGECLEHGRGLPLKLAEAVGWYRKAADGGDALGQSSLASCYYRGAGVTQDYATAAIWYSKAAEQGHAEAQNLLGVMCAEGKGVTKNAAEAVKWYQKAAEQGHVHAMCNLGSSLAGGDGVAENQAAAVYWFRKAAEQGSAIGQFYLGDCLQHGRGLAQDEDDAAQWYRKAADQGHPGSTQAIATLVTYGSDAPVATIPVLEIEPGVTLNGVTGIRLELQLSVSNMKDGTGLVVAYFSLGDGTPIIGRTASYQATGTHQAAVSQPITSPYVISEWKSFELFMPDGELNAGGNGSQACRCQVKVFQALPDAKSRLLGKSVDVQFVWLAGDTRDCGGFEIFDNESGRSTN